MWQSLDWLQWPAMLVTVFAYWGVGLPLGAWFGLGQHRGAPGLWLGLILGLSVAAIGLSLRVRARLRLKAG